MDAPDAQDAQTAQGSQDTRMPAIRRFFDIDFTTGSIEDIVSLVAELARAPQVAMVVTPKVDHIVALNEPMSDQMNSRAPDEARSAYLSADRFFCDSKVIARLARRHGLDLTPRTGTDRVADLLASPAHRELVI